MLRRGDRYIILLAAFAMIAVGVVSYLSAEQVTTTGRRQVQTELETILTIDDQMVDDWISEQRRDVETWATSEWMILSTQNILENPQSVSAALNDLHKENIRRHLESSVGKNNEFQTFYLVTPEGTNLAAFNPAEVDQPNTVTELTSFFSRVWSGETVATPPMLVDVLDPNTGEIRTEPRIIVGSPILKEDGTLLALLVMHIDPGRQFSTILELGNRRSKAESYAFNRDGWMVNEYAHKEDIAGLGLVEANESSILNIRITDPAVDLAQDAANALPLVQRGLTRMAAAATSSQGSTDLTGYRDYRGVKVVGAWTWNDSAGIGIAVEMPVSDAYGALHRTRAGILVVTVLIELAIVGFAILMVRSRHRLTRQRKEAYELRTRVAVQDSLAVSEARLNRILDSAPSAFIVLDASGTITKVNSVTAAMFGYPDYDLVGMPMASLFPLSMRAEAEQRFAAFVTGPETVLMTAGDDARGVRRDGSQFDIDVAVAAFPDGDNTSVVMIVTDVAERNETTRRLREYADDLAAQHAELEATQSALVEAQKLEAIVFLNDTATTEIYTPIQYVGDNTRFVLSSLADLVDMFATMDELVDAVRDEGVCAKHIEKYETKATDIDLEFVMEEAPVAMEQALEGIDRVATIVRALKHFSHPGSTAGQPIDINQAIESTVTVARSEWKTVAEVTADLDPRLPAVVADGARLNQVFLNLIVNAAHAIGDVAVDGQLGRISIATHLIDDDHVVIAIQDTGGGIPESVQQKIFDPFFTTKDVGKGTGQGLSIARNVVDQHGGTLKFDTTIGEGTTFYITLPVNGPKPREADEAA